VYAGSLTQPPCTQNVIWMVNKRPLKIKPDTLKRFQDGINGGQPNNRPIWRRLYTRIRSLDHNVCNQYNLLK